MFRRLTQAAIVAGLTVLLSLPAFGQASLMPNAKQTFVDADGNPYAAGRVFMYIPKTTTKKNTWQNSDQTSLNVNPIILDAAGRATIFGIGSYRQVLQDVDGNPVWDGVTTAPLTTPVPASSGTGDFMPVGNIMIVAGFSPPTNYVWANGQAISRATYPAALNALTISMSATCTASSTTIGGLSSSGQMRVGAPIEANCLAAGTTISTIAGPTSITVSAAATASGGTTVRVFNNGNGNGSTTFNVPDLRGRVPAGAECFDGATCPSPSRLTTTYFGVNPNATGAAGGAQSATLVTGNLPPYTPAGTTVVTDGRGFALPASFYGAYNGTNQDLALSTGTAGSLRGGTVNPSGSFGGPFTLTGTAQGGISTPFSVIQPSFTVAYAVKIQNGNLPTVGVLSIGGMTGDVLCGSGILCSGTTISADPSTVVLNQANIYVGNAANIATGVPVSGDCSLVAAGTITCTKTSGANFGTMATQNAGAVAITGGTIVGLPNPSASSEAATKGYVDAVATGLHIQTPVKLATTAALAANTYANGAAGVGATLTANANGALSIDSVAVAAADRVLIKDEVAPANNGIYTVTATGSGAACPGAGCYVLTRATDFDTAAEMLASSFVTITAGTVNFSTGWLLQNTVTTVGTTAVVWVKFPTALSQWINLGSDIYFSSGKVGIGSSATPSAALTVSGNASSLPVPVAGTLLQSGGANAASAVVTIDSFGVSGGGNNPVVALRTARGTAASPTAVQTSDYMGFVSFMGYGTSAYSNARGAFGCSAAENWTNTAQGANCSWFTTAIGGTTLSEKLRLTDSGNLGIGTTSPGAQLHVAGTVRFSGITGATTNGCLTNDTSGNISAGGACGTNVFNVKASPYNAVGNGIADDAAAIQAAVDAAAAAGRGEIYFPCGSYKINTRITTVAFPTFDRVQFVGDGGGCSQINVNNANGGFLVQITSLTFGSKFGFRELDIVCASGGACGTAISVIITTVVTGDGNLNNLDIHNVRIRSSTDNAATEKYTNGVYIKNLSNTDIYNLEIVQGGSNSGKGIYLDFANNTGLTPGYGIRMYNLHVEAMEYGFYSTGGLEGIQFYNPGIFGVNTGIRIDGSGGFGGKAGDLVISGGAINAKNKTVYVNQWKSIRISDVDLYKGVGSGTDVCDHNMYFENTQWTLLSNNHIATAISLSPCSSALVTGNAVDKFNMTGNSLQGLGTTSPGIKVFGGAVLTTLTGNIIDNLGGQLAINVNSNFVTCYGNAGGTTGGISTAGSSNVKCDGGNNNLP